MVNGGATMKSLFGALCIAVVLSILAVSPALAQPETPSTPPRLITLTGEA